MGAQAINVRTECRSFDFASRDRAARGFARMTINLLIEHLQKSYTAKRNQSTVRVRVALWEMPVEVTVTGME